MVLKAPAAGGSVSSNGSALCAPAAGGSVSLACRLKRVLVGVRLHIDFNKFTAVAMKRTVIAGIAVTVSNAIFERLSNSFDKRYRVADAHLILL